jgi:hypothetical protein
MARTLDSSLKTNIQSPAVRPFFAVKVKLPNASDVNVTNYMWTGLGDLTLFTNETYTGLGNLLSIGALTENQDLAAKGCAINLRTTNEFILVTRDRDYQGNDITIYLGAQDSDGSVIGEPFVFFDGFLDQMSYSLSGKDVQLRATAEHKLIRLQKSSNEKFTHENQQVKHSGDLGFNLQTAIANRQLTWGKT